MTRPIEETMEERNQKSSFMQKHHNRLNLSRFQRNLDPRIAKHSSIKRNATSRKSIIPSLILFCSWTLALPGQALDDNLREFTSEDLTKLRMVTAVTAPNHGEVAYLLSVPRKPFEDVDGPAWSELHVTDLSGRSRPYITGEVNISSIEWTPDGQHISFLAKREKDEFTSLYSIPLTGGEAKRVLDHKANISSYAWSPDGERIAFLATEEASKAEKERRDQGFTQEIYEEDWKPVQVWIADVEGNQKPKPKVLELEGSASELSWGPSGENLVVALAPSPSVDDGFMARKVWLINPDSGEIVQEINNEGKLGKVALSPDGNHLAIISGEDIHDPSEGRLLVAQVDQDKGELRDLLPDYQGHVADFAWISEKSIAFLGDEGTRTVIKRVDVDGNHLETIQEAGSLIVTALKLDQKGNTAALIGQTAEHPSELFLVSGLNPDEDVEPKRLTDSNPWLKEIRFAKQEVLTFEARDGLKLEGILIHPLDAQDSETYPLILYVHGGPEAHDRAGWLTSYAQPGQIAAAKGFAVFYPNYRGSTGRGVEFSKLGQADPAGKEFDDLIDAVDHLIEIGIVDKEKVGITGGSYGGYASAWGATRFSDRFAASVMFVGISDKISKSGTTDIAEEEFLVHARKRPWDDWQFFLERSPIYHVQQARTPTLILHGKEDPRVHPGQSLELYRYLKLIGKTPVRLVLYPGEGHGNRRAASRYDYNLRMLRWMEHFLKNQNKELPPYELDYPLQKRDNDKNEES